jgi:LysM repeat protein
MRIRFLLFLNLALLSCLFSCRASRHITSSTPLPISEAAYVTNYKDIAISEMKRTGIPASITLAQGMIESDYGRSRLAREANNHFGIKCHSDWKGPAVYHNDDRRNECFRKYSRAEDSFYDHSDFLKSGSRYNFLFAFGSTDYKAWAHGLRKAGYATNPDYANMLIRKIEEENLSAYDHVTKYSEQSQPKKVTVKDPASVQDTDRSYVPSGTVSVSKQVSSGVPAKSVPVKESASVQDTDRSKIPSNTFNTNTMVSARVQRVMENNKVRYIVVKDGDTREEIEEEFQLLRWELPKYNELPGDFSLNIGQILYLQPKKEKAEQGKDFHTASDGDTMYQISQKYGIKLKSLYKMNRMAEDSVPDAGSMIWLRSVKPVN